MLYFWKLLSVEFFLNQWIFVWSGVLVLVVSIGDSGVRNFKGVYVGLVEMDSGFVIWKEMFMVSLNYRE